MRLQKRDPYAMPYRWRQQWKAWMRIQWRKRRMKKHENNKCE